MNKFYTYAYLRENGTPYYIGKGSGTRAFYRNKHEPKAPPRHRISIIKDEMSEKDAFALEEKLILMWGRKEDGGILNNVSTGGNQPPKHCGEKSKEWMDALTNAQRERRRRELKRGGHPKCHNSGVKNNNFAGKSVVYDGVVYPSITAAAKAQGVPRTTMGTWVEHI